MKIESINNSKVKEWNKLKEKKYRDQLGFFLVEGDHLVKEALLSNHVVEIIALDASYKVEGIDFYEVTAGIMKKLSNQVTYPQVMAVCKKLEERDILGSVCILDDIQDPGNLGTIIRSAKAFSIDTIIMSNNTVDLYNEKVIRSTEGMLFNMNFIRGDLRTEISKLKENGYYVYGTNVQNGKALKMIDFPQKTAIIIGNEGKGMNPKYNKDCDEFIYIPIDNCESLNAGVAASIIFYEMMR